MDELSLIDTSTDLATMNADDIAHANYEVLRRAGRKASTVNQYTQTEKRWAEFCATRNLNPLNFEVVYVDAFFQTLKDRYSRTTLQNMLVAPAESGRSHCRQFGRHRSVVSASVASPETLQD